MDCIKRDLPRSLASIELHVVADIHKGDRFSDAELIRRRLEYIKATPNAYCMLNGDICNWATRQHKSDPYSETLKPMEQIQAAVDIMEPIKDKIIAVTPGNHEFRAYKTEGIDVTAIACREIGVESRYAATGALVFLRLGELTRKREDSAERGPRQASYAIYMLHGSGGGRKEGAKAIRLADMACIVDADIYIHSHTHLPMVMREGFYRTDWRNSAVSYVDKLFVNTGAALDYGGYGQAGEYKPASKETPVIYLGGREKEYRATL